MQTQLRLHSKQHLFQSCFSSFSFNAPNRKTNIRILSGSKREQRKLWFRDCCHKIGISSVVFNSSCFLVRFNYEVLSIHIYFYNLSNGITVKWIRNICFKDIETSTLVEKFMLIYQNLGWCTHIIHPHPLAALNSLLERILKEIFEMCFYFHDMMISIWNNLFLLINIAEKHHYYFCCYQFYIYWCAISSCQVTFFASALLRCFINT